MFIFYAFILLPVWIFTKHINEQNIVQTLVQKNPLVCE